MVYVEGLTHQGGKRKRLSRVWGGWQMAYANARTCWRRDACYFVRSDNRDVMGLALAER